MTGTSAASSREFVARWWIAFAGAALLLASIGIAVWQQADSIARPCTSARVPATSEALYSPARALALNSTLCLAIDMQSFGASRQAAAATAPGSPEFATLRLFIDGLPVPTPPVYARLPDSGSVDPYWQWVSFALVSDSDAASDDAAQWRAILSGPSNNGVRAVTIGVAGADDDPAVPRFSLAAPLDLRLYTPWHAAISAAGMLLLFGGLVRGGWSGGLLREAGGAFSLSRAQTLFWLALSFGGFFYIWLVSGQWNDVMTPNVLTLIGIAGITGISARVIDHQSAPPQTSSGSFFGDILSDGSAGLSVHRIQLLMWNIVLGAIFVWTAWWSFAFPEFDTNLLILAGLVNAAYLGFKVPENRAATIAAEAAAAPPPSA